MCTYLGKFVLNARRLRPVITSRRRRNYEPFGRTGAPSPGERALLPLPRRDIVAVIPFGRPWCAPRSFENPRRVWQNGGNYVLHKRHALPARPVPFRSRLRAERVGPFGDETGEDHEGGDTALCPGKFSAKVRQTSNSERVESDPPPRYVTAIRLKRTHHCTPFM